MLPQSKNFLAGHSVVLLTKCYFNFGTVSYGNKSRKTKLSEKENCRNEGSEA